MMKSIFVYLLTLATWIPATGQERPFETAPAYHADGSLRFNPPQEIDWSGLAPRDLRNLPVPTNDADIIARFGPTVDMFGGVEIATVIPTPDAVSGRLFYFAGEGGVHPMTVDSTRVVTRLSFDPQGTTLRARQSWGEVFGSPSGDTAGGGGFVLQAERALSFRLVPSSVTADDLLLGSNTVEQTQSGGYWGRGTEFWSIEAQYRFSIESSDSEWIFVQWAPDRDVVEAGCQYRYGLFLVATVGPPTQVAWTSYGCDV